MSGSKEQQKLSEHRRRPHDAESEQRLASQSSAVRNLTHVMRDGKNLYSTQALSALIRRSFHLKSNATLMSPWKSSTSSERYQQKDALYPIPTLRPCLTKHLPTVIGPPAFPLIRLLPPDLRAKQRLTTQKTLNLEKEVRVPRPTLFGDDADASTTGSAGAEFPRVPLEGDECRPGNVHFGSIVPDLGQEQSHTRSPSPTSAVGSESTSSDSPQATFRYQHVEDENGHHLIVGREGTLTRCEDEVRVSLSSLSMKLIYLA